MDPYVEIIYRKDVQQTQILDNAGKSPEWNIKLNSIVIE